MISLLPCSVRWRYQLAGPSQIKSHNRYLWIWIQKFEAEEKVHFFFFFVSSIKILPQCLKVPEMKIAGTEEITGKMSQHHCPSPTLFPHLRMTLVLWSYTTVGLLCQ